VYVRIVFLFDGNFEMQEHVLLNVVRLRDLLRKRTLKPLDLKVLLDFLAHVDDSGEILISQAQVARDFGMAPQSVWRSRQALLDCGVLRVRQPNGPLTRYKINEDFARF
jgi:hypothetical protein